MHCEMALGLYLHLTQHCTQGCTEFRHLSNKSAPASAPLSSHSADDFNHHFLTVAPQIVQQIPLTQNLDPISYLSLQHQDPVPDLEIITVEEETVHDLLCTLDHRTATGHDGIPPKFLKLCGPLISRPLTHIINRSLSESKFPSLHVEESKCYPYPQGRIYHLIKLSPNIRSSCCI